MHKAQEKNAEEKYAVMFADFAGSTRLYDRFGNETANQVIEHVMQLIGDIVADQDGKVIKSIGDELMCSFNRADNAAYAACQIQEKVDVLPSLQGFRMAVRIGLHWGTALIMEDGDLFGDAVNVAARLTGIARARQIITSELTMKLLDHELQSKTRKIDQVKVKGKSSQIAIYQVIWEPHDVTMMSSHLDFETPTDTSSELILDYQDIRQTVSAATPCLMFGRSSACDLMINTAHASRRHARIEYRRGKYILIDQSTNGTFVRMDHEQDVFLRGEEITLWGCGTISAGKTINHNNTHLLFFKI